MFELRVLEGLNQGAALPLFGEQWSLGCHADADLLLNDEIGRASCRERVS